MHDAADKHPIETDALVIGAGPAGLFQVFQLGLQGIRCDVVDFSSPIVRQIRLGSV